MTAESALGTGGKRTHVYQGRRVELRQLKQEKVQLLKGTFSLQSLRCLLYLYLHKIPWQMQKY